MAAVHQHLPPQHDPHTDLVPPGGLKLTPRHYAYLKISEGCNHKCSFCIIPSMRGLLASRKAGDVLREAESLVEAGVRELLVISQDTSAYGADTKYQPDMYKTGVVRSHIQDLSKALGQFDAWVRLHYVYPYPHVNDLINLMSDGILVPYLDVPFQHGSLQSTQSNAPPGTRGEHPRADPQVARDLPGLGASQHLHRRLSRGNR